MEHLDAEELIHIAIESIQNGNREAAISQLKRSIQVKAVPRGCFLLGAEYAQIGMYERAAELMHQTLELDPYFLPARYQLGLLHITTGDNETAIKELTPMLEADPSNEYYHVAKGVIAWASDDLKNVKPNLEKAMELNQSNPALNNDLTSIINDADQAMNTAAI
jgi:tetratricopeptide (TPR) repeat protein